MNEKRIRLMTKLTVFQKQQGKQIRRAFAYYRSDFIGIHLVKNTFRLTLAFLIGLFLWFSVHLDMVMDKLNTMDIWSLGRRILVCYVILLVLYLIITYIIYSVHFFKSEKQLQTYQLMLEQLEKEYSRREPSNAAERGGRMSRGRRKSGNDTGNKGGSGKIL